MSATGPFTTAALDLVIYRWRQAQYRDGSPAVVLDIEDTAAATTVAASGCYHVAHATVVYGWDLTP